MPTCRSLLFQRHGYQPFRVHNKSAMPLLGLKPLWLTLKCVSICGLILFSVIVESAILIVLLDLGYLVYPFSAKVFELEWISLHLYLWFRGFQIFFKAILLSTSPVQYFKSPFCNSSSSGALLLWKHLKLSLISWR